MNSRKSASGFNLLGYFYNPLKRIFLHNKPERAITNVLANVPLSQNILIVGGGADNTIAELLRLKRCSQITQVDISSVLTRKAKQRNAKFESNLLPPNYVVSPFLNWNSEQRFDWVIFPFYLDLFADEEVIKNIDQVKKYLNLDGRVLVIDFISDQKMSMVNSWLIKALYFLFYPFTGNFRNQIPDYQTLFSNRGFQQEGFPILYKEQYEGRVFSLEGR